MKLKSNQSQPGEFKSVNDGFDLSQFELEHFHYSKLTNFFKTYKNSKIYLFYSELRNILWEDKPKNGLICINQREKTYNFDVTSKTIKNWLIQLQKLNLIDFKYNFKDVCHIQIKNYENLEILNPPTQKESGEDILPTRFYKNVQLIIKNVIKEYKTKTLLFENEKVFVSEFDNKKELASSQNVYLKIKLTDDECFERQITYEHLVGKPLPSIKCNYHQAIIKKRVNAALHYYNQEYERMQLAS